MDHESNSKNVILGIDPGIADTGYGIIKKDRNGNLECIRYGTIKTAAKDELPARLMKLNQELARIIKKYKPQIVGVEHLYFCKNVKTALVVAQARGVVLLTARLNNSAVAEFTPLQVKQAVAAYGQASKTQVQKMVKILLNMKELPKPDDASDALAVAICAANSLFIVNRKS